MHYPAKFTRAIEGGWLITFRDLPEAISQCEDSEEREAVAAGCLQAAVWGRKAYGLGPLPTPSKTQMDEVLIAVPPETALISSF
jgi:antitoxin HicB